MIEVRKNENIKNYKVEFEYNVFLNGVLCEGTGVYTEDVDMQYGIRVLEVDNFESTLKLRELPFSEFFQFDKLVFNYWREFDIFTLSVEIERFDHKNKKIGSITFRGFPELSFWKQPFNFAEYQNLFNEILNEKFSVLNLLYGNNKYNEFTELNYYIPFYFGEKSINEELEQYISALLVTHKETIETLHIGKINLSLLASFNFPEEIRNTCEQYLLYFAQFVLDLGINVTSNLKEEAGKVLFSVTPTDDIEALDKIREALAVYLNLPASPIVYDESFAAMRLQQQIENLQHSQRMAVRELQFNEKLLVAQSDTLHEKNLTISQQQSVIEQQDKIIEKISSKSIMMDSAENKEELEELYDGVKVGESETLKKWLGISLNPAKAIKTAVKNTFGKEDVNKSVLGLDEEL